MTNQMSLPFEIVDVEYEIQKEVLRYFPSRDDGFVYAGPQKYFLYGKYTKQASKYYNMEVRPDDVWVATLPRSGTTWTQEMVWLINNNLDYDGAAEERLNDRFPFLEYNFVLRNEAIRLGMETHKDDPVKLDKFKYSVSPGYEKIPQLKSPRHIKTHLPFSLLPPKLIDTCKVIYVARNPKDVAVSYHSFNRMLKYYGDEVEFSEYWDLFQRGLVNDTPFWPHVEEAWNRRHHKNLLFLFYEDMKKDLPSVIRKTAKFLGKNLTKDEVEKLANHLDISNFRKNPAMDPHLLHVKGMTKETVNGFFRQGTSGTWKTMFTPELNAKAEKWIREHEKHTTLRFQF